MKMHSNMQQKPTAALVAFGGLITAVHFACAQPLQPEVLVSFNGTNGANPHSLTQGNDGNFYGTTAGGGSTGNGTVFRVTTNGEMTTLVSFNFTNGAGPSGLTFGNDCNFYGTTLLGGANSNFFYGSLGTVFQVTTNGWLTTVASFDFTNGAHPDTGLTRGSDGNFYGTTADGPGVDITQRTVFRVTTNGILTYIASLGYFPQAPGLTAGGDGNLYGTTAYISADTALGFVFGMTTSGVWTTLISFPFLDESQLPYSGLTLGSDGNLYGTTAGGPDITSPLAYGTLFRVTTNGALTTLARFPGADWAYPAVSQVILTLGSDGSFYGTSYNGGITNSTNPHGYGAVFQVTTNGVLTTLVSFNGTNGAGPAGLTLGSDGNFYGTTSGGVNGQGIIYRLRHGVSIQSFGMKTNGFQLNTLNVGGSGWVVLESSPDLNAWTPIQTNGTATAQQFLDPAALSQPRQFYRLRQQ